MVTANAYTNEYSNIEVHPEFEVKFLLTHETDHEDAIVLDCQSFLNKIDFFDSHDQLISENFIDIHQCEEIYLNTMSCFDQGLPKCIKPEDIFSKSCNCPNS